jgi:hypothetical protein
LGKLYVPSAALVAAEAFTLTRTPPTAFPLRSVMVPPTWPETDNESGPGASDKEAESMVVASDIVAESAVAPSEGMLESAVALSEPLLESVALSEPLLESVVALSGSPAPVVPLLLHPDASTMQAAPISTARTTDPQDAFELDFFIMSSPIYNGHLAECAQEIDPGSAQPYTEGLDRMSGVGDLPSGAILHRSSYCCVERACGTPGPVRVAKHLAREKDEIGLRV